MHLRNPFHRGRDSQASKTARSATTASSSTMDEPLVSAPTTTFTSTPPTAAPIVSMPASRSMPTALKDTPWAEEWAREREAELKPARDARWAKIRANREAFDTEICSFLASRHSQHPACLNEYRAFQEAAATDSANDFGWQDLATSWVAWGLVRLHEPHELGGSNIDSFMPVEESPTPISAYIRTATENTNDFYKRCPPSSGGSGASGMPGDDSEMMLIWQESTRKDLEELARLEPLRTCLASGSPSAESPQDDSSFVLQPPSEAAYTGPFPPVSFVPVHNPSAQVTENGLDQSTDIPETSASASVISLGTALLGAAVATVATAAAYQAYQWWADETGDLDEELSVQAFTTD